MRDSLVSTSRAGARCSASSFCSHVQVSIERSSPAGEREEGKRHRDGHIHSHHAHFNLVLVLASCRPRLCEDGSAIAVRVGVHQRNSLIQSVCLHISVAIACHTALVIYLQQVREPMTDPSCFARRGQGICQDVNKIHSKRLPASQQQAGHSEGCRVQSAHPSLTYRDQR